MMEKIVSWWGRRTPSGKRLDAKLAVVERSLKRLIAEGRARESGAEAQAHFDAARDFYQKGQIEQGWNSVNAAQQACVSCMNEEELAATAEVLRLEKQKIRKWREDAASKLLEAPLRRENVREAMAQIHEHYQNTYTEIGLLRRQLVWVVWLSGIALVLLFWILGSVSLDKLESLAMSTIGVAMLFGVLGAGFSGAQSLMTSQTGGDIPARVAQTSVTWVRLVFGSIAGLVAYIALESKLVGIGELSVGGKMIFAFSAGFSERIIVSIVKKGEDKAAAK